MNDDQQLILIYFVDDAVGPASGGAHPFEFPQEWSADAVRIVDHRAKHELDDGCRGPFGQPAELTFGWSRDP